ncbi:MAG: acetamidase/formamidase family protein [Gemmataceae bacterium]
MKVIPRDQANKFAFNWMDSPLLEVEPGEVFEVETWDAGMGYFRSPEDKAIPELRPGFNRFPPEANPIAGPIFLKGCQRGDLIQINIIEIEVGPYSWIATGPQRGPLGNSTRWPELSSTYTTRIFSHLTGPSGTTKDGTLHFSQRISWPITPFIGTIGVAPDREVATSLDGQGPWGGNLDIRDVCPGNRIYLPVYHPGGLLYLGDVHASQGDTEFSGTAAETTARVKLQLEIVSKQSIPWMRIEKNDSIVTINANRPLELAVEAATIQLMEWMVKEYGFSATDAYCLVSTCPDFRINVYQMCKIGKLSYVAGAEIPRRYLQ